MIGRSRWSVRTHPTAQPASPVVAATARADRPPVIELTGVVKTYGEGEARVFALAGVDLVVQRGEYVAIMGASGSGKSTLMNVVGCLDAQTKGRYRLDGIDVRHLDEHQLSVIRNRKIGFVFQSFNLLSRSTALSNVALPLAYAGVAAHERRKRAHAALDLVGLHDRASHRPAQLSGGQQQKVAIARAVVTNPVLLLADEPTGALDSHSSAEVLGLFDQLWRVGRTIVIITHERDVAAHAERLVRMRDGRIISDERQIPAVPTLVAPTAASVGSGLPPMAASAATAVAR
jgi:putative ABC transport system ATP-binding protein